MNLNNIRKIIQRGVVLEQEPMNRHTSFRVGGPARYFIRPATLGELAGLVRYLSGNGLPYFVLGNGSNLLVSDRGYEGAIIDLGRHDGTSFTMLGIDDQREDGKVLFDCGAGCLLSAIGSFALRCSATGFEALSGIPGCIGGACIMNAGAYGSEIGDVITAVTVLNRTGEKKRLERSELTFGYRHSSLLEEGYIVLRAEVLLDKGDPAQIEARMKELTAQRKEKQPLEYPSAGSTFKRTKGDFAGRLIEEAGLRGYRLGGAMVSEKHCGFIINDGTATAADIAELIEEVSERVKEKFGVSLEPEVIFLGDF